MKFMNYEKRLFLFGSIFLFFISFIFFLIYTFQKKYEDYFLLSGVVRSKNLIEVVVDSKTLNLLYQNSYFYLENKKRPFTIKQVTKNVLKRENISYHELFLFCDLDKKRKETDVVSLVFIKKREVLYHIYQIIWKGD